MGIFPINRRHFPVADPRSVVPIPKGIAPTYYSATFTLKNVSSRMQLDLNTAGLFIKISNVGQIFEEVFVNYNCASQRNCYIYNPFFTQSKGQYPSCPIIQLCETTKMEKERFLYQTVKMSRGYIHRLIRCFCEQCLDHFSYMFLSFVPLSVLMDF